MTASKCHSEGYNKALLFSSSPNFFLLVLHAQMVHARLIGTYIIFQDKYLSFKNALKLGNILSLKQRRIIQITKFSKKSFKNPRFKSWFCETDESQIPPARARNRRAAPLLKPVTCRTQRYARSSLPVMTSILSWHPPLRYTPIDLA